MRPYEGCVIGMSSLDTIYFPVFYVTNFPSHVSSSGPWRPREQKRFGGKSKFTSAQYSQIKDTAAEELLRAPNAVKLARSCGTHDALHL